MPKLRSSHLGSANPSPDRTERGRKPKMKKMSTVKRKVARSISTARRATTGNKLSKRFVGIRMSRIQKGLNRGRLRKSGSSTNTPLSRSPHGKLSPIKTRRLYKSKQVNVSRCTICKTSEGDLTSCTQCHKLYHLSKCILYSAYMIARVAHVNWLCPKCIRCSSCHLMIDDPTNVECVHCLQAWHGACQPPGSTEVDRQFFCKNCLECVSQPEGSRKSSNGTPRRSSKNLNKPSSSTTTPLRPETCSSENQRRKRRRSKGSTGAGQVAVTDITPPSCSGTPQEAESEEAKEAVDPPKFFLSSPKSRKDLDSSPERKSVLSDLPDICSSSLGGKLFDVALAKMEEMGMEKKPNATKEKEQWVNIGGESDLKVLYDSPYPDDIKSVPLFFVCAYCLKPFSEQSSYFVHQDCCPRIAPPGREIYRDSHSSLSFFEVDGAVERTYCRYLCLLAMLFISSKTSHNEVGTFYFYILTKNDENGCRILGYFSKEKNPSRNNNLSCLLTIPSEQRHGYGHLLIDMSYQLSSIERKVGSPEHPLSDLGLFTYRKYWKSSILCYLRSRKDSTNISIKSMSLQTRIHPTDIVNELMRNNLLVMKDGNYFIKTWKLAFKFPLSALRRRVVDASRIKWAPDFDVNTLDPYKLNHYA